MWKSQDEWRLVSCDNLLANDYNCKFYPVTKVYLGVNMKNDQRREIIDICKRRGIPHRRELKQKMHKNRDSG